MDIEDLINEIIKRVNEHELILQTQQEINTHVGKAIRDILEPRLRQLEKRITKLETVPIDSHRVICTWLGLMFSIRYDVEVVAFALWMKYQQKERLN
jgi:hypothetical protein